MASLAKALIDYTGNLLVIQWAAQHFAQLPPGTYDASAGLSAALADTRAQRDAILVGLTGAPLFTEAEKSGLGALINGSYDSTEAVVRDPRGAGALGKALGQPAGFWMEIRPFAKHVTTVLLGLLGVAGGVYIGTKFILPQITDPTGIKAKVDTFFTMRDACSKMLEKCTSDPDPTSCVKAARIWCKDVEDTARDTETGCGLFDTAYGTLIGGLLGVGLGWSGMRRIMDW